MPAGRPIKLNIYIILISAQLTLVPRADINRYIHIVGLARAAGEYVYLADIND